MFPSPRRIELSEFQKGEIIALSRFYADLEVGRQLSIPHATVSAFLNRYANRKNYDNLPHPGRPRKTSDVDNRFLVHISYRVTLYGLKYP